MSTPVVLITGALTGIGRATAVAFAAGAAADLLVRGGRHHGAESQRGEPGGRTQRLHAPDADAW